MKYWRGYLTAFILAVCTWALKELASTHTVLVDMIYPYVTRMAQNFLVSWNGSVSYCIWQVLLLMLLALIMASAVLMVVLKWNPIQWLGWVCAVGAAVVFLNTGIYGLNEFSGPLSEDIRLEEMDYTVTELEKAATYYQDQANELASQVPRSSGAVVFDDFATLSLQAADGYETLVYKKSQPVFAGSFAPVKVLGWADRYTAKGITGVMVGITGEAAVNPQTPAVLLPFAMCREMAHRMCIAIERDASFAAYLSCVNNEDIQFQYSGALMAYRYCLKALQELEKSTGKPMNQSLQRNESAELKQDLAICDEFFGKKDREDGLVCDLLVSWHIQQVVLPAMQLEEETFDPLDSTQVDLSGIRAQ